MNTHLTIHAILAAGALAALIGMTSALSVARAGEVDARSKTLGASGPPEPSLYVDYDNTWLTGTSDWNAARATGWRELLAVRWRAVASSVDSAEHAAQAASAARPHPSPQ